MAFTTITVTLFLSMVAMVIAILVGNYAVRNSDMGIIGSLVVSAVVIPIVIVIMALPMYNLVTIYDWPSGGFLLLPSPFVIWTASMIGGVLGIKSGMVWEQGEPSCLYCLLSVVSVITVLSLVVVLFL